MASTEPPRSPLSMGFEWASRITTISLEFTLPALAGWWIDRRWGTEPGAVITGASLGFLLGMLQLIRIGREKPDSGPRSGPNRPDKGQV